MRIRHSTRLTKEDFDHALTDMGTYIDVTVDDLMEISNRARIHANIREKESLLVGRLMTSPLHTVRPDTTLSAAAHAMVTMRISGLPVVDQDKKLAGIITEADLLRAIGVPSHHPTHNLWQTLEAMFTHHALIQSPEGNVASLMTRDIVTIRPEHTLHEALGVMKRNRIKRIIVSNDDSEPVGMITRSDLVRVFFDRIRANDTDHTTLNGN
ncbi:MAG: hypothetical protein CMN57_13225 [Gammaproteobacteria bacterium]|nr:hypothetical protein [Gammaproteobacteria bacterium]